MKSIITIIILLLYNLALFAQCNETLTDSEKNRLYESDRIEVKGLIERPTVLTIDSLKKLNVHTGGPFNIMSRTGEVKQEFKTFKGVLLKDIVTRAGMKLENKAEIGKYNFEKGSYYIVLTATNGYRIIYTYNELVFTSVGDNAYVVFERNGAEISDKGKIIGFCITDKVTGARNIQWLKSISVEKLQ